MEKQVIVYYYLFNILSYLRVQIWSKIYNFMFATEFYEKPYSFQNNTHNFLLYYYPFLRKTSLNIKWYERVQQVSWKFDQVSIDLVDLMSRGCQSTVSYSPPGHRMLNKTRHMRYSRTPAFFTKPFCCSNLDLIKENKKERSVCPLTFNAFRYLN